MTAPFDIATLRAETPGCAETTYFNAAGAGLPPQCVLDAITGQLAREARLGPMEAAAAIAEKFAAVRGDAARLIGAGEDEVAFASGVSAAWGTAFAALPPFKAGERILVGRQEWGGNLATMAAAARRYGVSIETIPVAEDGSVDPAALEATIDARVRLISLTWLPANGGLVNDAAAIGTVARRAEIPYFVDAAQAVGQIPVNVETLGCDMLCAPGRKHLRGPRGTALLYLRRSFWADRDPLFLDVSSSSYPAEAGVRRRDAARFETSETSPALRLGLGAAIGLASRIGVERIGTIVAARARHLRDGLRDIGGVRLHDLGTERSGLVSFTVDGHSAQDVRARLAAEKIIIGANGVPYTPLDMAARGLTEIARAAVSYLTTDAEISALCAAVARIAAGVT